MAHFDLQIGMDGWQYFLRARDVIRVWRPGASEPLAELPVELVTQLVSHYLLHASLTSELQGLTQKPALPAPPRGRTPAVGPPSPAQRAALRSARHSRAPSSSRPARRSTASPT